MIVQLSKKYSVHSSANARVVNLKFYRMDAETREKFKASLEFWKNLNAEKSQDIEIFKNRLQESKIRTRAFEEACKNLPSLAAVFLKILETVNIADRKSLDNAYFFINYTFSIMKSSLCEIDNRETLIQIEACFQLSHSNLKSIFDIFFPSSSN